MPRYVALLRGVNVGGANRVPMAAWRANLESLGCSGVRTVLASGNAVFAHASRSPVTLAARIRAGLVESLGVDAPVIVRTAAALAAIAAENRLAKLAANPSRLLVAVTAAPADLAALAPVAKLALPPGRAHLGRHALYIWCPDGIAHSEAAKALLGRAGRGCTTRNWATVMKIGEGVGEGG